MPFLGLSLLIQIALVAHVFKTGRDRNWVWVLIFAPVVGSLAYIIVELLPDLFGMHAVRALRAKAGRALNPGAELRAAETQLKISDTVDNRCQLARALLNADRAPEAYALLEELVTGSNAEDTALLLDFAEAALAAGKPDWALAAPDQARAVNPAMNSPEGHLIHARALEALERFAEADASYRALIDYYPGEEARFRYAMMLKNMGQTSACTTLLTEIIERSRLAPRFYRRNENAWIKQAKHQLSLG